MNRLFTIATIFVALFAQNANAINCMGTVAQKCQCIKVGPGGYTLTGHTGDCTNLPSSYFFNPVTNSKCSGQTIACEPCTPDANGVVPMYCMVTSPVSIQIPSAPTLTTNANGENCGGNGNQNVCEDGNYMNLGLHSNSCVWTVDWANWGGGASTVPAASCFNDPAAGAATTPAPTPPPTTAAPTPAPTTQVICGDNARNTYRAQCCGVANPSDLQPGGNSGLNSITTCGQLKTALEDAGCNACTV